MVGISMLIAAYYNIMMTFQSIDRSSGDMQEEGRTATPYLMPAAGTSVKEALNLAVIPRNLLGAVVSRPRLWVAPHNALGYGPEVGSRVSGVRCD